MIEPEIRLTAEPLRGAAARASVTDDGAGAIVTFEGTVRDHTGDFRTDHLVYEAYGEMAEALLREIALEACERWPLLAVAVHHREGKLEVGEVSVVVAVSAAHRAEAFAGARYIIDELKERAPIWKKEVGPDGEGWVEGPERGGGE